MADIQNTPVDNNATPTSPATPPDAAVGANPPAPSQTNILPFSAPTGPTVKQGMVLPAKSIGDGGVDPNTAHHNMIGRVFNSIFTNQTPEWVQTEKGPVQVQRTMAPGEVARGILAAAVTGLAAGYAPENRGKGAGASFGAGVKAEGERNKETGDKKQAVAQKQFENKRETDEDDIRKAQNIREQLRSVEQSQEHDILMKKGAQDIARGDFDFSEKLDQKMKQVSDTWNTLQALDAKPATVGGQPIPEFNDLNEADLYRAQHHDDLMDVNGGFQTRSVVDPVTHKYVIMRIPNGMDDPQWLGVKKDSKTNQPIMENGHMIPDGTYVDADGKAAVPAGKQTPRQFEQYREASQDRRLNKTKTEAEIREYNAKAVKALRDNRKDREEDVADREWNKAQGDPNAVDEKGNLILSPASRVSLTKRITAEGANAATVLNNANKTMSNPMSSPEEIDAAKQDAEYARGILRQNQATVLSLGGYPKSVDVISNKLREDFTKADGSVDVNGAVSELEKNYGPMPAAQKQAIRQQLAGNYPDVPPAKYQQVVNALKSVDPANLEATVNALHMSPSQRKSILIDVQKTHAAPPPPANGEAPLPESLGTPTP